MKEHICDKIWFDVLEIDTNKEGFTILKTRQPITNRLSAWCITWRDAIEIIEPKELKEHTLEMIDSFRKANY